MLLSVLFRLSRQRSRPYMFQHVCRHIPSATILHLFGRKASAIVHRAK